MDEAKEVNKVILAEEIRIQRALLQLGYFAFRIQFHAMGPNGKPDLYIEARGSGKGDEELIGLSEGERKRLLTKRWFESKNVKLGG